MQNNPFLCKKHLKSANKLYGAKPEKPEHMAAHVNENQAKLIHNNSIDMQKWLEKRRGNHKAILEEALSNQSSKS